MIIQGSRLTVRYPRAPQPALRDVSLALSEGELVALVGPNGSGKTTLLRALLGTLPLATGQVELLGRPLGNWTPLEMARVVGVVTQREESLFPLTVQETVSLGRYAHLGPVAAPGDRDRSVVAEAMQRADVTALADRGTESLSGGEWQRVRIARALAQQPRLLILDEPTASLDIRHEMEVFELARGLAGQGIATLLVTHHLNLAARYADRLILLHQGACLVEGVPAEVLTPANVTSVFEWPVAITTWCDGAPQIVPLKPGEAPAL
ncbi:MAG: ABC transporter ATP-binding protein [Gemmatimonadota bacterium]